jgi:hypothetical protein
VRGGEIAGFYVANLGLEVALAVRKRGRGQERHGVWQLLEASRQGDQEAGARFVEYARTMKGRRQLTWSKILRDRLGLEEVTDAEILEATGEQDEAIFAILTKQLWRGVLNEDCRGELLAICGQGSLRAVHDYLQARGLPTQGFLSPRGGLPGGVASATQPNVVPHQLPPSPLKVVAKPPAAVERHGPEAGKAHGRARE